MELKKNRTWFWIITMLILALLIVFIAQNHQNVRIQFLVINLTGPGFLVFLVVFFLGFFSGMGWDYFRRQRRLHRQREQHSREDHKNADYQGH